MGLYRTRREVPWSSLQAYQVVADVERYPEFLPGWRRVKVICARNNLAEVEQDIGIGPLSMHFMSTAEYSPNEGIEIRSHNGPFSRLDLKWAFTPTTGGCLVDLSVSVSFRSGLLDQASRRLIEPMVYRIMEAFERRARDLYQP